LTKPTHKARLDAARALKVEQFLSSLRESGEKTSALNIERIAAMGGLHEVYDTLYRSFSGDASHVSAMSLNRYLLEGSGGRLRVVVGPNIPNSDIDETLEVTSLALHACLDGLSTAFDLSLIESERRDLVTEHMAISKKSANHAN
jgi:hypothetical protein